MLRPKKIEFINGEKHYQLRIEYWIFRKGKILPRYSPTYILSDGVNTTGSKQVGYSESLKESLEFLFEGIVSNLFAKLNTFWQ